jgi:hypothetical protein
VVAGAAVLAAAADEDGGGLDEAGAADAAELAAISPISGQNGLL